AAAEQSMTVAMPAFRTSMDALGLIAAFSVAGVARRKLRVDEAGEGIGARHTIDALPVDEHRRTSAQPSPEPCLDVGLHSRRISVVPQRRLELRRIEAETSGRRDEI